MFDDTYVFINIIEVKQSDFILANNHIG